MSNFTRTSAPDTGNLGQGVGTDFLMCCWTSEMMASNLRDAVVPPPPPPSILAGIPVPVPPFQTNPQQQQQQQQ